MAPVKLNTIINDYLFSGREPLRDNIISSLEKKPGILQRKSIGEQVLKKMLDFVDTFINGVPAMGSKIYELPKERLRSAAEESEGYKL